MDDLPIDLLLSAEPAFYLDWRGVLLGLLILAIISWGFWQDSREQ